MTHPPMVPILVMDIQLKLTQWRRAKGKTSTKAKAVALLAMNGCMHGCMDVDGAGDAPTKVKEGGSQKARTEKKCAIKRGEIQKERKAMAVERLPMGSVPTVLSLEIGAESVPTWWTKLGNRSLLHPTKQHPQLLQQELPARLQAEGPANLEVLFLPRAHLHHFRQFPSVVLKDAGSFFTILHMSGQRRISSNDWYKESWIDRSHNGRWRSRVAAWFHCWKRYFMSGFIGSIVSRWMVHTQGQGGQQLEFAFPGGWDPATKWIIIESAFLPSEPTWCRCLTWHQVPMWQQVTMVSLQWGPLSTLRAKLKVQLWRFWKQLQMERHFSRLWLPTSWTLDRFGFFGHTKRPVSKKSTGTDLGLWLKFPAISKTCAIFLGMIDKLWRNQTWIHWQFMMVCWWQHVRLSSCGVMFAGGMECLKLDRKAPCLNDARQLMRQHLKKLIEAAPDRGCSRPIQVMATWCWSSFNTSSAQWQRQKPTWLHTHTHHFKHGASFVWWGGPRQTITFISLTLKGMHSVNTENIQCDFFFMDLGKKGAVVFFLAVDVWSRYVTVVPLKQRDVQTVGQALVIGDVHQSRSRWHGWNSSMDFLGHKQVKPKQKIIHPTQSLDLLVDFEKWDHLPSCSFSGCRPEGWHDGRHRRCLSGHPWVPDRWTSLDWCSRRPSRELRTNGGTPGGWANGRAFWPRWWHCRPGISTCKATQWSNNWQDHNRRTNWWGTKSRTKN